MDRIDDLVARLDLPVGDRALISQALTHSSWMHEHPGEAAGHNERLEFLGDAVINLAISEALYANHPDDDEGLLSSRRAAIVSTTGLARLAGRIGLGDALRLGEGEALRGGRLRPSLLASALEAVAGAILTDRGWDEARAWVARIAAPEIRASLPPAALKSPKSRLQEHTQRTTGGRPEYRLLEAVGPDHEKVFRIEVVVDGRPLGAGVGPSRRSAETNAAAEALEALAVAERGVARPERRPRAATRSRTESASAMGDPAAGSDDRRGDGQGADSHRGNA
ncbi:MAG TPA: ribonuclease III [Candidatus Limnocylindrales bacterium]|nr:ribonuclease III [Candidatus Limnocylindrales bacterium]